MYNGRTNAYELIGTHHHRRTPQWHWAKDVDQVIRVEDLSHRFENLQALIGCYSLMPMHNTSQHQAYQEYYQEDTCNMVGEWFDVDIDTWGYHYV
jgi:hypothetical protein